jgi:hypothetical protein
VRALRDRGVTVHEMAPCPAKTGKWCYVDEAMWE